MPGPEPLGDAHGEATLHWMPVDGAASAVIVLPGGGYSFCSDREAENVGGWLNGLGISAAVLRYRVAPNRHPKPLEDAYEAMRQVRQKPGVARVGILGYSAGGHLAGTCAAFGTGELKPDVAVLCYPVVSLLPPHAHGGSRNNLLGEDAPDAEAAMLSLHRIVPDDMPPTFVWQTGEDEPVPPANALLLGAALAERGTPFELHLYERGRHGLSFATDEGDPPEVATWATHAADFLERHGFGRD